MDGGSASRHDILRILLQALYSDLAHSPGLMMAIFMLIPWSACLAEPLMCACVSGTLRFEQAFIRRSGRYLTAGAHGETYFTWPSATGMSPLWVQGLMPSS